MSDLYFLHPSLHRLFLNPRPSPGCCSTSAPVILEQPSDTVVARGEPVTLNCKVEQQSMTWILTDSHSLTELRNTTKDGIGKTQIKNYFDHTDIWCLVYAIWKGGLLTKCNNSRFSFFCFRFSWLRDLDWIPLLFLSQEKFLQSKVFMRL